VGATIVLLSGQAVTLVAAYLGYRATRNKVDKVHKLAIKTETLVNNQLDRQLDRNAELTASLTAAGVHVPEQKTAVEDSADQTGNGTG
jgi:hypothetical protein